jgi:ABC-2 type transport system permease protein
MKLHRLVAIARKEVIQLLRDWRSLVIVGAMPIVLTLLFGYGVRLDLKHTPMCVYDREGSQASQDLVRRFSASEYFRVSEVAGNYRDLARFLDSGECKFGLVVPQDFSKNLAAGMAVPVQAVIDASDDNTARIVIAYGAAVVNSYSEQVQIDWLDRQGKTRFNYPIKLDYRTWFNEELESKWFVIPGVIAILMAVIGTFLTSLTISREWERGTMEQLISTPVTPLEVITGKLIPYFVIGLAGTGMCAAVGVFWFAVPFRGSLLTLFGTSTLFLGTVLGLGFWISAAARSQLVASQVSLVVTFMPAFVLSGFIFAIDQMPAVIRAITYVVAARYYDTILKAVFLKGVSSAILLPQIVSLAILAAAFGILAMRAFRKRLD